MLGAKEIMFHLKAGNIVIDPFDEKLLNTNSYDVRLGEWYSRQREPDSFTGIIRYNTEDGQTKLWKEPVKALDSIIIYPHETILSHTMEFIGGKNIITTEMKAKSTTGRYGLTACKCAGLGDVGYIYRWTLEIENCTKHPIAINPGERIAQITFHTVGEVGDDYNNRNPRYGFGPDSWHPIDMLPKAKKS